ncbi:MAG: phosphoglycerate kinase, partial [Pseudomonadota bacterium]
MSFNTLDYVELAKKRVLVRVDINTPVKDGEVSDDTRIRAIVPTIEEIIAKGGKAILLGHFGRPKGQVVPDLSLEITRDSLTELLGVPVHFIGDCLGPVVDEAIERCPQDHVILLENTRFHPEEEANDPDFAAQIARLGDVFV